MRERWKCKSTYFVRVIIAVVGMTVFSCAQTYTTLASFNVTNGDEPYYGPLVQGRDGNLYGTALGGGANANAGTIFKMTPGGTLTVIYNFCAQPNCTDGASSVAGLVLGRDGNFYGTTLGGGNTGCAYPQGCGVLFKVTPKGVLTTLHTFGVSDVAAGPIAGLVQGSSGPFFGAGGLDGGGAAFYRITAAGVYTELAGWDLGVGGHPYGGLIQAIDGWFYGTSYMGGTSTSCNDGCGTVFKIQASGKNRTTVHSFDYTDGANPVAGLVQADDGNLYGATLYGGTNVNTCAVFYPSNCGTIFEINPKTNQLTTLYTFCPQTGCLDGLDPMGTLIQATDGNLYGTTNQGGLYGSGTIYQWNPTAGAFSVIVSFPGNFSTGAGLMQATNGKLYGTTVYGGTSPNCPYGCGSIFSLDLGLSPFVRPMTYSGKAGATVEILGQGFGKSTTVSFNGTPALSSVKSGTYLTATVPVGATTGSITVTNSGGTLTSDRVFRVLP